MAAPRWQLRAVVFALALVACATGHSTEKGGLVKLPVSAEAVDTALTGRRIALVVGIDRFQDAGWRNLRFASKDATDLGRVLGDGSRGGFEVELRTEPQTSTREAILTAVRELRTRNTSADDEVLLYFSTHGTLARDASGSMKRYLVAADTRVADVRNTGIALEELQVALDQLPSRRKVLVLAMCHSGSGKSLLPPEVAKELEGTKAEFFRRPLEERSRASIVLAACDWGETAREDEQLANDIYTHFLVEALERPADRNGDGAVTATEAHDYARRRTYAFTEGQQRPSAEILEVGADPVVLEGHIDRAGQPELFGYEASLDGFGVRVDGADTVLLPGAVAMAAGAHHVQVLKGDGAAVFDRTVNLGVGERVDVGELMARGDSSWLLGAALGYQGFLDADASRTVAGPTPALQLSVQRDDLIARHLALRLDGSFATGSRTLQTDAISRAGATVPFRYLGVEVGLAAPYGRRLGPLELDAGPRISAVYLARHFTHADFSPDQSYLVVSPGLAAGAALRLTDQVSLLVRLDAAAEVVSVDGASRTLGHGAGWIGLGWRP